MTAFLSRRTVLAALGSTAAMPAFAQTAPTPGPAEKTIAERLADYAAALQYGDLGAEIVEVVKAHFIDAVGCTIGAFQEPSVQAIRSIALAQPGVRDVGRVLSMYVGPDDALVTMDLDFDEGTAAADAALAMAEVERRVRERFPMIKRLFIESGSPAQPQRWSRPDAIRTPPTAPARSDSAVEAPAAP